MTTSGECFIPRHGGPIRVRALAAIAFEETFVHPAVDHILQFFVYDHLPEHLQPVSKPFAELAELIAEGPANPETTVALRKLLEAKDAAVRAVVAG